MTLFEVSGWSVSAEPVSEKQSPASKKRKRPSIDSNDSRLKSAEANLEKAFSKRRGSPPSVEEQTKSNSSSSPKAGQILKKALSRHTERKREKKAKAMEDKKKLISHPMPLHSSSSKSQSRHSRTPSTEERSPSPSKLSLLPLKKKVKTVHDASQKTVKFADEPRISRDYESLTPLQQNMKRSLDGARFRVINEALYKNDSATSHKRMKEDPAMFYEYHAGFRHQVSSWPTNPVQTYIDDLSKSSPGTIIADLGCGDAALAKSLNPLGLTVLSYDLVSDGTFVVEADICDHIPLPGSEGVEGTVSKGDGHIVDIVVCALSLMGTNWPRTIREAWRILKAGGELRIAEVASRFTDEHAFIRFVEGMGFESLSKDKRNTHFTLFKFGKVAREFKSENEWRELEGEGKLLKPCEYKRR